MDTNKPTLSVNSLCPSGQCQAVVLITDSTQQNTMLPFDSGVAGQFFAASFISGISLWLISLGAGQILRLIR